MFTRKQEKILIKKMIYCSTAVLPPHQNKASGSFHHFTAEVLVYASLMLWYKHKKIYSKLKAMAELTDQHLLDLLETSAVVTHRVRVEINVRIKQICFKAEA